MRGIVQLGSRSTCLSQAMRGSSRVEVTLGVKNHQVRRGSHLGIFCLDGLVNLIGYAMLCN